MSGDGMSFWLLFNQAEKVLRQGASRLAGGAIARRAVVRAPAEAELRAALPLMWKDGDRAHHAVALLEAATPKRLSTNFACSAAAPCLNS